MNEPSFEELLEDYGPITGIERQVFPGKSGVVFIRYRFGRAPGCRGYFITQQEAEYRLREVYGQS